MPLREILDHALISERYFFPFRRELPDATHVPVAGGQLACWRSGDGGPRPLVVHFHGNGETVHDWMSVLPELALPPIFDVFLVEYRGYGASDGEPQLAAMLDDIEAVAAALGVPPELVVVFGRSVGSIYALEWVHRFPTTAGLILESGIHDVYERIRLRCTPEELGCTDEQLQAAVARCLDHSAKLAGWTGPTLLLHAEQDNLVTIDHAERNAESCGGPARLVRLPEGDHNSIFFANAARYESEVLRFLRGVASPEPR